MPNDCAAAAEKLSMSVDLNVAAGIISLTFIMNITNIADTAKTLADTPTTPIMNT